MNAEMGSITALTLELKKTRKLSESNRNGLISHITSLMAKLAFYAHAIEQRYSAKTYGIEH